MQQGSFPPQPPPLGGAEQIRSIYRLAFRTVFDMTYERLADLVKNRMRMSHVYQPVTLMALLGEAA